MLVVHAADIHLDAPLKGRRVHSDEAHHEVRLATRRAFINLIELCTEEKADLLLLAGDVFDSETVDFNTGLFAHRQLAQLREVGTRVVIVKGNHDAEHVVRNTLADSASPHVTILDHKKPQQVKYEDIGVAVTGQSYERRHVEANLVQGFPIPVTGLLNIGLLHTDISGIVSQYKYAPCVLPDLINKKYDYWALGHVHTRRVLQGRDPLILYPGNTQGRHINETGPKGCTMVYCDDGEITSVEMRQLDAVRWECVEIVAQPEDNYTDVLERVSCHLQDQRQNLDRERRKGHPLVAQIRVTGATDAHYSLARDQRKTAADIIATAARWDIWPERVIIGTEPLRNERPEDIGDFLSTLDETFVRLINEQENLDSYIDTLQKLQIFTERHPLEQKPADEAHVRGLLRDARALIMAHLRVGSDVSPVNEME